MARLWIKICGMSTVPDIEAAVAAGADALGFVFFEPSPRHLSLPAAQALQAAVPAGVERVAVFLHPAQSSVDEVIDALRPDWLQTDLDDLLRLRLPAFQRVLPVLRRRENGSEPVSLPEMGSAPFSHRRVMLEGATSGQGQRADWDQARVLAERCELVLAGGLDAGNVSEAVRTVRPYGVDVSSGVERARGIKDPARIRAFIRAARAAEQSTDQEAAG
jgi:phosphoribosylanthranilate isomerase